MPEEAPVMMAHLPEFAMPALEALVPRTEHVCRVKSLLQFFFPLNLGRGYDTRQESASQFANPMVMRERAAGFQDLISRDIFQLEIDLLGIRNSFVIKTKIEINADSCSIDLCDACRHKRITRKLTTSEFVRQSALYVVAECKR